MSTIKQRMGTILIPRLPINRRTFAILRYELNALLLRAGNFLNPVHRGKLRRLRGRRGLSLNVGSAGRGRDGWINVDISPAHRNVYVALDIRRPLPFEEGQFQRILAEQVIEHIDFRHEIPGVLREFHRVLAPGGVLRVIVPDARRYMEAYLSGRPETWRELGWDLHALPADLHTPMHVINHVFHQEGEHLFGYDFETLELVLRRAGFQEVARQAYLQSWDPDLAIDREQHRNYSLYVEARK